MDDQDQPIRSQEAAIQTATVEVKTLTLKGRQLTLEEVLEWSRRCADGHERIYQSLLTDIPQLFIAV